MAPKGFAISSSKWRGFWTSNAQHSVGFCSRAREPRPEAKKITEDRKESAKTDMILKEASRRRLAGIPFDDEG
jgi:hypothetical protein